MINPKYRGNNLDKILMKNIMEASDLNGLMGILATKDAHGLYEQYDLVRELDWFM